MKKIVTMMLAVLMMIAAPGLSVFAEEAKTVWIDTQKAELADGKLQVAVSTDGTMTDGVLTLNYDSEVLGITEESDVKVGKTVDMYAVNLIEGVVKVSYVSEQPIEKGDFLTITFSTQCTDFQKAVNALEELTGEGYAGGKAFSESSVSILKNTEKTPGTAQKEDKQQTQNPNSGDSANLVLPIACLAVAAAGVILCVAMKKKKGGNSNEI